MNNFLIVCTASAICLSTPTHTTAADKYALLVGVTKYRHSRMNDTQLQYPEADATAVGSMLRKSGYTVVTLLGKRATKSKFTAELKKLSRQGSHDGVVVIGIFGHGVQYGDDAYFGPYETRVRLVTDSRGRTIRDDGGQPKLEPDPESPPG